MSEFTEENDRQFLDLFNGKDEIVGSGKSWTSAVDWLRTGGHVSKKVQACVVFYEHPIKVLASGKNSKDEDVGKAVNTKLVQYLPQHDHNETTHRAKRTVDKYGAFIHVNFSMVRRVALLSIELGWGPKSIRDAWISAYGNTPSKITDKSVRFQGKAPKTVEIKMEGIKEFQSNSRWWMGFSEEDLVEI